MGLLSKLLGKEAGEALENLAKEVTKTAENSKGGLEAIAKALGDKTEAKEKTGAAESRYSGIVVPSSDPAPAELAPAGTYWGPVMPAEENQYNFNGPYIEYFRQIFKTEFPEYGLDYGKERTWHSEHFTFWDGERKALVVEILPKRSNAKIIRARCRAEGVPYLRYYHDVEGWWNVRSYVVERTRKALKG